MSDPKAQAKLEIQEIIEKIEKGESPNTSRAHELIGQFDLGNLEAAMTEALDKAAASKQQEKNDTNPEISTDPLEASKNFFDTPARKEVLDVHSRMSQGAEYDPKNKKPSKTNITKEELINVTNTVENAFEESKKFVTELGNELDIMFKNISNGTLPFDNKNQDKIFDIFEQQLKHQDLITHGETTKKRKTELGIESNSKLFSNDKEAAALVKKIAANQKEARNEKVENFQERLNSLKRVPVEKETPQQQSTSQRKPQQQSGPAELNEQEFKEKTPVEYVNLGASRSPSSTPKPGGRGPAKEASKTSSR